MNNARAEADIAVDLNGAKAINHAFSGSGRNSDGVPHAFEFQVAPEVVRVEVRVSARLTSTEVDLRHSAPQWVVVQNYETDDLGVQVTAYEERPLFG